MNPIRALWIPFEVADIDEPRAFYRDRLGLSEVDSWSAGAERGTVLRAAPGAFLEFVSSGGRQQTGPPPLAFELPTVEAVRESFAAFRDRAVVRPPGPYPRGHYGFEIAGPADTNVMVWTEKHYMPTDSERE